MTQASGDKVTIHPRITQKLYDEVTQFRELTNRSLSGAVNQLLTEALDARQGQKVDL